MKEEVNYSFEVKKFLKIPDNCGKSCFIHYKALKERAIVAPNVNKVHNL